jgi:predicted ATP-grasp superfamily ATP-dependent carboligase
LDSHTFLKRIIFARHELRWQPSRLADPIGPWHSFHDLPADGTIIRRGEPILTLLTKLPPRIRPADVLRSHRNLHQQVVTTSLLA